MREKLPKMRKCSILHYALVKNACHLRFSHVFLAFVLTNITKTQTKRIV